jgi:para-nitrobenzyl esterase
MRRLIALLALSLPLVLNAQKTATPASDPLTISTESGPIHGALTPDGVRSFLGIPYAAPPVGDLRWRAPQPAAPWTAPRNTTAFGPHCVQFSINADMVFRDAGPSEDCLTLNIWVPPNSTGTSQPLPSGLPVMVWIYGGGFTSGSTSEPRQDGQFLAQKGVIVVSMNYRLGLLGFLALPELTAESPHHASGNYGLLDQAAAIAWVHRNIGAFGGDAANITLFGESAGSFSVSAQMASPLTLHLLAHAIGESGAGFAKSSQNWEPLSVREIRDHALLKSTLGTEDLAALRKLPVDTLTAVTAFHSSRTFEPVIDGYFLPDTLDNLYAAGKQAHISLLAGWNHDEARFVTLRAKPPITAASFAAKAHTDFGANAEKFLALYPARNDAEALASAGDYAGDTFLVSPTWKWLEDQVRTGDAPVYRYRLDLVPPTDRFHPTGSGAFHSDDIEYVFGTLDSRQQAAWRPEDRQLSTQIMTYWTNFARTGNPNSDGLPTWPRYEATERWPVMLLDHPPHAVADTQRARYLFLNDPSR